MEAEAHLIMSEDMMATIIGKCDARSLCLLAMTCRKLRKMAEEECLWQKLFEESNFRWRGKEWALCRTGGVALEENQPRSWRHEFIAMWQAAGMADGKGLMVHNSDELCEAVRRTSRGDDGGRVVYVAPGKYECYLSVFGRVVIRGMGETGSVQLCASSSSGTQGEGDVQHFPPALTVMDGGHLAVSGVTFGAACSPSAAAVEVFEGGHVSMVCCDVHSTAGRGVLVHQGASACLLFCDVVTSGGACFSGSGSLRGCSLDRGACEGVAELDGQQQSCGAEGVVELSMQARAELDACVVRGGDVGVLAGPGSSFAVRDCSIAAGTWGVSARACGGKRESEGGVRGEVSASIMTGHKGAGLHVRGGARVTAEGCVLSGNRTGVLVERWQKPIKFLGSRLVECGNSTKSQHGCKTKSVRRDSGAVLLDGCEIRGNLGGGIEAVSKDMVHYTWCAEGNMEGCKRGCDAGMRRVVGIAARGRG